MSSSTASTRAMPPPLRIDAGGSGSSNSNTLQQQHKQADIFAADAIDTDSSKPIDPLDFYHRHMLDSHPGMDASIASDDDLLDLLRNTKDKRALKWIEDCGLPLSAQLVPVNYPPWKGRLGEYNASVQSFESPIATALSSRSNSPEEYWRSPDSGDSPSSHTHVASSIITDFDSLRASSVSTLQSSRTSDSSCQGSSILTHSQYSSNSGEKESSR
ncbi:hypothetical protein CF327_g1744 [Tilletia walkeri]|nr:hypothetical protein CF327_g1744 [Tilletia walkeri]